MKVILPVAGKGTRLRPHTWSRPKSLVHVAGKTILEHIVSYFEKVKVDEFIFITDENGETVERFVENKFPQLKTTYIVQEERLGPAHAVWLAHERVVAGDEVLVVFNDTLFVTDLTKIPQLCQGLDGLIYSKEVEDYRRFGVNVMKDGTIVDMVEKPDTPVSKLAQVGLYYLQDGRKFMDYLQKAIDQKLTAKGEYYLPEVFKLMIKDGIKFGAPEIDEWLDCGKPETLLSTNRYLLEKTPQAGPKIVSSQKLAGNAEGAKRPTAGDEGCEFFAMDGIMSRSPGWARATTSHPEGGRVPPFIEKLPKIEGCAVVPPVFIDPSAKISRSVIGPHVSIGENCRISNCIIKNSIIHSQSQLDNLNLETSIIGGSVEISGNSQSLNVGDNCVITKS